MALFRSLIIVWLVGATSTVEAAVTIDWSGATINTISSQSATVTGMTSGDTVVPYTVTITSVGSPQDISFAQPLGANTNPLNMNLPATRVASSLMTVSIALGSGFRMVNPRFTLLDIDTSPNGTPPYGNWQDEVIFQTAGVSMTSVNAAYTTVTGSTVVGINGNVVNGSPDGNVNVNFAGTYASLVYTYGPGPSDLLGSNQRHGISVVTFDAVVPEPGTWAMLGLVAAALSIRRVRKKVWALRGT